MRLYNFDDCKLSDRNSSYGGNSGDKEGVLINGEYWLIKYPKRASKLKDVKNMSYTLSPVSEYIGSHIYKILGYPVHHTELGLKNNHIVVACKDLCDENHKLLEFRQLKNTYNKTLNEKLDLSLSLTGSAHFVNLNELIIHLKYNPALQNISGLKERFWDCVVIDGLINNNDRNNGNWGILRGKDGDKLAPIFDNGASFSPNVPEYKLQGKLKNLELLKESSCNCITAYSLDGENNALFRDIIKLDIPELKKSIVKNVPLIQNKLNEMKDLIDDIPNSNGEYEIISKERQEVYKIELEARFKNILQPEYNKIISRDIIQEKIISDDSEIEL